MSLNPNTEKNLKVKKFLEKKLVSEGLTNSERSLLSELKNVVGPLIWLGALQTRPKYSIVKMQTLSNSTK